MAWESTPWLVGGGAEHTAEVARLLAHAGTGGAEGIVTPGDLKVQPLAVPGGKVRIAPGAVLVANRYPGGGQQTYVGRNTAQFETAITATGSSGGRTDLVVARVLDPQYEGSAPANPNEFDYMRTEVIQGVPAGTTSAQELNLNYPAVALARIDLPANTGTVQAAHITDVRQMAQPRKERHLFVYPLVQGDGVLRLASESAAGQYWPDVTAWTVKVPDWAQRVRMVAQWGGVYLKAAGENAWGRLWVRLGSTSDSAGVDSQVTSWDLPSNLVGNVREAWMGGDDRPVPAELKGRTIPVGLRGNVLGAASAASKPELTSTSVVSLDVEFYETAV